MITSDSNGKIKGILKLQRSARERKRGKCFLAEGVKMVREAFECGKLQTIYFSERLWEREGQDWQDVTSGVPWEVVSEPLFHKIADTVTPQGVLGVVEMPEYSLEEMLKDSRHAYILLDDIRDPGNLGTILRTAEGAGMSGVVMSRETVDIFNPKVVRSTMGAIFRVPFVQGGSLAECILELKARNIPVYGTMMDGSMVYDEPDYSGGAGIVIGNEANGISREVAEVLSGRIRIPMEGRLESLNASVTGALLMYEMARQRRRRYYSQST